MATLISSVSTSPYPTPSLGAPPPPGSTYKFTVFINGPNCGFSETWYVQPAGTFPDAATMDVIAQNYALTRGLGLDPTYSFQAYRYSDVVIPGNSTLRVPLNWPTPGLFPTSSLAGNSQGPAPNGVGTQVRITDQLNVVRRNEILRGIPDWFVGNYAKGANSFNPASNGTRNKFFNALAQWTQTLTNDPTTKQGIATLRFAVKNPGLITPQPITFITTNSMGLLEITVPALPSITGAGNIAIGNAAKIGGVRLKCARKINGTATVINIQPATAPQQGFVVTLCKPLCCLGQPVLCPRNAFLYPILFGFAPIKTLSPQIIASRKTGRPFRLRPGRRAACCA